MKKIFSLFFCLCFFTLFINKVWAADLNIDCSGSSSCSKLGIQPLFNSADGYWYPGRILTKTLNLKNSSTGIRDMALKGIIAGSAGILEDKMQLSIVPTSGGIIIWSGSLANFYGLEKILMGTFNSGADLDYNLSVSMDFDADNTYQTLTSTFDLGAGFWGDVITPTPIPDGGGSGDGGGGSVLSPTCNDNAPGSAPTLLSATASGANQITLTWAEASSPVTYYLVSYRTPGDQQYGNPNIGGAGTTSYTVTNLSGGETYYFKVRAGNGCMPGVFSNELSVSPSGGVIIGSATGFQQNVLGINSEESTSSGDSASITPTVSVLPTGEVKGTVTAVSDNKWLLFFVPFGLVLLYWFAKRK